MFMDRYALANLPRYTSYPPANRFDGSVDAELYATWLKALDPASPLSLYLHVPFCRSLCWYCGCHTSVPNAAERVERYADRLGREIELVVRLLDEGRPVTTVHFGGGTPTILAAARFRALTAGLRSRFDIREGAEIAVEIDPRVLDDALIAALAEAGVTRASLGVQDLDPEVQWAINRVQPFETVARAVEGLRAAGIHAINADLMYGLPKQTGEHVERSARAVAELCFDRVAVFGYAHVPWFKSHQRLIDAGSLPGARERFEQAEIAAATLTGHGYAAIGFDHFARPHDPLALAAASGRLRRNFQGYVVDPADAMIGLGASSIGALPGGYVQNEPHLKRWAERVDAGELPAARGARLTAADRLRRAAIERILCDGEANLRTLAAGTERATDILADGFERLHELEADGLVVVQGWTVRCTPIGRRYARNVAACFDAGLVNSTGRHSRAV